MGELRGVELSALLEIARRGAASPAEIHQHYDVEKSYVSSRLSYLKKRGLITQRANARGLWEITPEGWEALLSGVRGLTLELVLAARLVNWDMSVLGKQDRVVIRFNDGSITAYLTGSAQDQGEEIDLGLELLSSWPSAEAVETHLESVRPRKQQD